MAFISLQKGKRKTCFSCRETHETIVSILAAKTRSKAMMLRALTAFRPIKTAPEGREDGRKGFMLLVGDMFE